MLKNNTLVNILQTHYTNLLGLIHNQNSLKLNIISFWWTLHQSYHLTVKLIPYRKKKTVKLIAHKYPLCRVDIQIKEQLF